MITSTTHKVYYSNSKNLTDIEKESVSLVVTSPPYPMIEMWDESFSMQNPSITDELIENNPSEAFELMHKELDAIWNECYRVLKPGGIACINIGDATRSLNKKFELFSNHARIVSHLTNIGFSNLPNIIWRKQTNAPNKFMGSGMLPPGAYVTLEHEFILIFRKGNKREFSSKEKPNRRQSAYFWEERNKWFSDLWNLKGVTQKINKDKTRERSAAYPFEIPYRLINMFSTKGDVVLDPFLGTGTTTLASIACRRDSIGYELSDSFHEVVNEILLSKKSLSLANNVIRSRILNHKEFVVDRKKEKGKDAFKYENEWFKFPVITRQEKSLELQFVESIQALKNNIYKASYIEEPIHDYLGPNSLF